jgi:DNA-directed RNA polymerase specialized sigma24 family protein
LTGEECVLLFNDLHLRNYVIQRAKGRAKTVEDAEDYVQLAWLSIWQKCEYGWEFECYCACARRAIKTAYERDRRRRQRIKLTTLKTC